MGTDFTKLQATGKLIIYNRDKTTGIQNLMLCIFNETTRICLNDIGHT